MNYLAIDTSGKNLTVIVKKEDKEYIFYDKECGVNHSVQLMPRVEELASKADFDFSDADFFACVVGAGSFTGIRIGVATVKALCFAFNKPCLSVTSFDTLAYNKADGNVLAVIDAKHGAVYACGYENGKVVFPPSYIKTEEAYALSKTYTLVSSEKVSGLETEEVSVATGLTSAIQKKLSEVTSDLESLVPLYVRKSQAEENR